MSQTLCKIEVFPAFALPIMSTLNWIFGTWGPEGAGDGAGDGAGAGDGGDEAGAGAGAWDRAGDGAGAGVGDGAGAAAGVGAGSGDSAGADAGAGDGGRDGPKQQVLCFAPIARKSCEKKDRACVDHSSEFGPCFYSINTVRTSADWCACYSMY